MTNLSKEELAELTRRANARLAEFDDDGMSNLSVGYMRIAVDVFMEWQAEQGPLWVSQPSSFDAGFERGVQAARRDGGDSIMASGPIPNGITFGPPANGVVAHEDDSPEPPPKRDEKLTEVTPPRPIGRDRVPAPDVARAQLATALAAGQADDLQVMLAGRSRKLREADAIDKRARQPTREQFIAEVQSMAMGGVMPTMAVFDDARPATWSTAWAIVQRLGFANWSEVGKEAGLKPNVPRKSQG